MPSSDETRRWPGIGADAVIGLVIILFSAAFLMKTAALPEPFDDSPGPALFPTIILSGLLIAGAALVLNGLRPRPARAGTEPAAVVPVLGLLATIAGYVLALRFVPFLVSTPLMIVAAALVALRLRASRRDLVIIAAAAVLGTLLIQIVFIDALGIRL